VIGRVRARALKGTLAVSFTELRCGTMLAFVARNDWHYILELKSPYDNPVCDLNHKFCFAK
jgi:hypothetical protein